MPAPLRLHSLCVNSVLLQLYNTCPHFLPWCFAAPWVWCQWKPSWNVHMHSLEVGEESPPGTALSQLGWKPMDPKPTMLRDIFLLLRRFQWDQAPDAHRSVQLNSMPWYWLFLQSLMLLPSGHLPDNLIALNPYLRLCFQGQSRIRRYQKALESSPRKRDYSSDG